MHKLMHINPIFTSSSSSTPSLNSLSLGFNYIPSFLSLGFINTLSNYSTDLGMSTTLHLRSLAGGSAITATGPIHRKAKVGRSNCGICRCNMESLGPFRAWSVLKGRRIGLRFVGYHMEGKDKVFSGKDGVFEVAAKDGEGEGGKDEIFKAAVKSGEGGCGKDEVFKGVVKSEGEVKKELEKRRLNRRQRGNEGGVAALMAGSPDLLAIPGVGPRNLKKLVEKGIGGVAQLKRIYKDKV